MSDAPEGHLPLVEAGLVLAAKGAHHVLRPLNAVVIPVHRVAVGAEGEVLAAQLDIPLDDAGVGESVAKPLVLTSRHLPRRMICGRISSNTSGASA